MSQAMDSSTTVRSINDSSDWTGFTSLASLVEEAQQVRCGVNALLTLEFACLIDHLKSWQCQIGLWGTCCAVSFATTGLSELKGYQVYE